MGEFSLENKGVTRGCKLISQYQEIQPVQKVEENKGLARMRLERFSGLDGA